jgi:hypothetical protein
MQQPVMLTDAELDLVSAGHAYATALAEAYGTTVVANASTLAVAPTSTTPGYAGASAYSEAHP